MNLAEQTLTLTPDNFNWQSMNFLDLAGIIQDAYRAQGFPVEGPTVIVTYDDGTFIATLDDGSALCGAVFAKDKQACPITGYHLYWLKAFSSFNDANIYLAYSANPPIITSTRAKRPNNSNQ